MLKEMGSENNEEPLIGTHGTCSQILVNLLLTGEATAHVFNGVQYPYEDSPMHAWEGITRQPVIGLLTLEEAKGNIIVGSYLKQPKMPFFLIMGIGHTSLTILPSQFHSLREPPLELHLWDGILHQLTRFSVLSKEQTTKRDEETANVLKNRSLADVEKETKERDEATKSTGTLVNNRYLSWSPGAKISTKRLLSVLQTKWPEAEGLLFPDNNGAPPLFS